MEPTLSKQSKYQIDQIYSNGCIFGFMTAQHINPTMRH